MIRQSITIGLGFFGVFFATQGVAVLAIPYYHMLLKVNPFYLGLTITLPILISALINPYVGKLFDEHTWFVDKSFIILISGWFTALLFGFVWMAPIDWPQLHIIIYLSIVLTAFSVCLTFLSLSAKCLVFEKMPDQTQRGKQFGTNAFFEKFGSLIYYWMFPLAYLLEMSNIYDGVRYIGWIISIVFIGGLTTIMALANRQSASDRDRLIMAITKQEVAFCASHNAYKKVSAKVNWILLNCFLMFAVLGVCVSFDYYLLVFYMFNGDVNEGSYWKGILSTAYAVFGILYIPIIVKMCQTAPYYKVLRYAYILALLGGPMKWVIFQANSQYMILLDALLGAAAWAGIATIIPTMLGAVAQGVENEYCIKIYGWLNARHNFVLSMGVVISLSVSGLILNLTGFDAKLPLAQNEQALEFIRYIFTGGTTVVAVFLLLLSFNKHRQL